MKKALCILPFMAFCSLLPAQEMSERTAAFGAAFSWQEISLNYVRHISASSGYSIGLNMDMTGVIAGDYQTPGISADFFYKFIFASKRFKNGEIISGYAGPGVKTGWLRGEAGRYCFAGGLCGTVGLEYSFSARPVSLSLSLQPFLSFSITKPQKNSLARLDFSRKDFFNSLYPKVGIKYLF